MKEQIKFIKWMFTKLDVWQWTILVSLGFNLASVFTIGSELSKNLNYIGAILLLVVFTKWFVYDTLKASWGRYKQERNELLTTIKDSDR